MFSVDQSMQQVQPGTTADAQAMRCAALTRVFGDQFIAQLAPGVSGLSEDLANSIHALSGQYLVSCKPPSHFTPTSIPRCSSC